MTKRISILFFAISLGTALAACGGAASPTPTPIFVSPTQSMAALPTESATITAIPLFLSDPTATPVSTPVPPTTPARTPTAISTPAVGKIPLRIYLVKIDDNGKAGKKIGCNDSIVAVERQVPATQGVLAASLDELLSLHDKNYSASGLHNALYQSTLKLDSAAILNGRATIAISGKLVLGGVCDNPRVKYQIEETALQFATVKSVAVTINGVPIDKVLSEK